MKITVTAVAALAIASVAATTAIPANANPRSAARHAPTSNRAVATATSSACHRKPAPTPTYIAAHSLDAVQFVSATIGWVAGADRVLATTDGGARWSVQRSARRADYSEVDAIDADHAWVVGRHQLIATTNGGATWKQLPEPCPVISSVHFSSASDGVAVAGGKLTATSDGGKHWRTVDSPATVQTVCFTSSQSGWLGADGHIYRTTDAGQVWAKVVAGPKPHSRRFPPFADVQCAGPDAGWAELIGPGAAASQEQHIGYSLNDHGSHAIFAEQYFEGAHAIVHRRSPGAYFAAFSSIDPSDAAFVDTCAPCGAGTSPIGVATNQGNTFRRPGRVRHVNFATGAAFVSTTDGWVVGQKLHFPPNRSSWKIEHTTDGGRHWTTQYVE